MGHIVVLRRCVVALACAALLLAGCSDPPGVKVEGKLVKGGQPYTFPAGDLVNLSFTGKTSKGEEVFGAKVNPSDGSFTVDGPKGRGVPPGKYKITLNRAPGSNDPDSLARAAAMEQEFALVDGKEVEITAGASQKVTIDLATGAVTR